MDIQVFQCGEVKLDDTYSSDTQITVVSHVDEEGKRHQDHNTVSINMDNHQMYKLAMLLLKRVDVIDNRGSK